MQKRGDRVFVAAHDLLADNRPRFSYGIAVADVDGDGRFAFVVTGFGCANRVLAWQGGSLVDRTPAALRDFEHPSIGLACADIDGDGHEEIYVLGADTFGGPKRTADRLFDATEDGWSDLVDRPENAAVLNRSSGRSVACLDRLGTGRYGFVVASYGGPFRLYELEADERLADHAPGAHLDEITGGRSLVVGPIVSTGADVFAANELGPNFLFRARADGSFREAAEPAGLADAHQHGRGVALLDADGDGRLDLAVGNWEGPHRLFLQTEPGRFVDRAPPEMAEPSRVRTVIAADFDNDGFEELFFNNIGEPNRLFGWRDGAWRPLDIGDAEEPDGLGTGAAVADLDGDGQLELMVAHGESAPQPLGLYRTGPSDHHWLRVLPRTRFGAPARGALVTLEAGGRRQLRVIDGGSGYLCQMEPVAHFGLGGLIGADRLTVRWPDGASATFDDVAADGLLDLAHPQPATA
jgi:hypothetical protein